ncbi:amino acid transporter [Amniculicola lignicola CBS 123094]|uniref:Amino acid transporter n=1 Tax=Amniculicola lignicola CBS 123094 TaxID=1392246 RepID=A0A6A5WBH0_9PLEO|nr:amino acid transporter [Amniculicola lignicola CBS 123094]
MSEGVELLLDQLSSDSDSEPHSSTFAQELEVLEPTQPARKLSLLNGIALVLGLQIGSGVFSTPSQVSQHVPSPGIGVIVWILGGLLVWTGAASFIELGLAITENGGIQEYLRVCYGDFAAFLFAWLWLGVSKPCSMALIATVFAEYMYRAFTVDDDGAVPQWVVKVFGLLGLASIAFINCVGVRSGLTAANIFLFLKVGALLSICLLGLGASLSGRGSGIGRPDHPGWFDTSGEPQLSSWSHLGNTVTALFGVLFCYNGWESIGFVVGDLYDPQRNLPRVLSLSMATSITGFAWMNVAFYTVLSMGVIRGRYTVAVEFGNAIMGTAGAIAYSLIIAISALGALNANTIATAALCEKASEQGYFPRVFARTRPAAGMYGSDIHERRNSPGPDWLQARFQSIFKRGFPSNKDQIPRYAVLLNTSLASLFLIFGTFDGLVTFIGISGYVSYFWAVSGVFVLRRRLQATSTTPLYQTWLGNPILFCTGSAIVVIRGIITNWWQGAAVLAFLLAGWTVYRFAIEGRRSRAIT